MGSRLIDIHLGGCLKKQKVDHLFPKHENRLFTGGYDQLSQNHLKLDNNAAKDAIRPFVMRRKNWLFSGAPRGADVSATFFNTTKV
ncbi:IS66 family transposase [Desulfosarcina ovata]|uniref:Transposase IS66 central domain-containing protein n=2 Tax=Desulfosarcina ovata TaxID=83564 RepID=A0A5K8AIX5_9BACT|nr:hypothetical protein DSCO28_61750 [Desulfosarcina ovata subsp. sediminis]BBO92645.1 hypothetical protein DSCOOX_58250 [Desulfosarcina ovata subsp. ovata]